MRALLTAMLAVLMLLPQRGEAYTLPKPDIIAIYFYADWCPNCKALSPVLEAAKEQGGLRTKPALFVTFDLTDKPRIHQSILLAQGLGLADYMKAQGSSTGYVALLDATTKTEIVRFDRTSTAKDIAEKIAAALAAHKH